MRFANLLALLPLLAACGGATPPVGPVPAAPRNVKATASDRAISATWEFDADPQVTGFILRAQPGNLQVNAGPSERAATLTGLTNGTAYSVEVFALIGGFAGDSANAPAAVTPFGKPTPPTGISVARGDHAATVSWAAAEANGSAVIGYDVAAQPGGATATSSTTSATVTGLTNGVSYTFTVTARNGAGASAPSAGSAAVTPAGLPAAPALTGATAGVRSATFTFTEPDSNGAAISSYAFELSTDGASWAAASATVSGLTASVTNLDDGAAYYFRVAAQNEVGKGPWSAASASIRTAQVPAAPAAPVAVRGDGSATVSWTAPASATAITSYTVTAAPGGATVTTAATSTVFSGLTNGTAYTFTVVAANAVGASAPSPASAAVTPAGLPGAPAITSATGGSKSAALAWTAAAPNGAAITQYTVQKSTTGGATWTSATATVSGLTATVTGLASGTQYVFRVLATNAAGTTASAASQAVTTAALPGKPVFTSATRGDRSADLAWTAPADGGSAITGYNVVIVPGAGFTVTGTSAHVTGLSNGSSYTFTVAAVNAEGAGPASDPSDAVIPAGLPGAPGTPAATPGLHSVALAWTAAAPNGDAVSGYFITASPCPATCTTTASGTSATISGLDDGTEYTFSVSAQNSVGTGAAATSAPVETWFVPSAPYGAAAAIASSTSATVTWTAPDKTGGTAITAYKVLVSTDGVTFTQATATISGTSATVTGLTSGSTVTFAVYAVNAVGNSAASESTAAITLP